MLFYYLEMDNIKYKMLKLKTYKLLILIAELIYWKHNWFMFQKSQKQKQLNIYRFIIE